MLIHPTARSSNKGYATPIHKDAFKVIKSPVVILLLMSSVLYKPMVVLCHTGIISLCNNAAPRTVIKYI